MLMRLPRTTHMSRTAITTAELSHPFRLLLITLLALAGGACHAGDPVSPPGVPDALTRVSLPIDGGAIQERTAATFIGSPKRKAVPNGRLAFTGYAGSGVHVMEPDGFGLRKLADGTDPSWSPDGNRIAFTRWSGTGFISDVYVMDADGGNARLVTRNGYHPTWSPDGRQLAFGCGGICIVNVDGSGRRVVLANDAPPAAEPCARDSDPTWSPNGTTIAFTRWPDSRTTSTTCLPLSWTLLFPFDFWTEVWFVESDGTGERPLRGSDGLPLTYAGWPSWSPDGSELALYSVNTTREAIMVANADGSGLREVARRQPANFEEFLGGPDWSPDGQLIVLGSGSAWGFVKASGSISNPTFRAPFVFRSYGPWSWSRR